MKETQEEQNVLKPVFSPSVVAKTETYNIFDHSFSPIFLPFKHEKLIFIYKERPGK